jgi:hypothetical protein
MQLGLCGQALLSFMVSFGIASTKSFTILAVAVLEML